MTYKTGRVSINTRSLGGYWIGWVEINGCKVREYTECDTEEIAIEECKQFLFMLGGDITRCVEEKKDG